jgi:hypothetical protein
MSKRTLASFLTGMKAVEIETAQKANQFKRAVALQVLSGVVMKTPVDTGRARGNWQASINTPDVGPSTRTDPNGGTTIAEGSQEIENAGAGDDIWIHNNLIYVPVLETGTSMQAPTGMLEVTLAEVGSQFG